MKLSGFVLLAAIATGGIAAAPAVAQDRVEVHRTVTESTTTHGPALRHGWHRKKICRTHWYHHRKVTRCTWRRWR
jgi:hypothetical protein